MYWLAWVLGLAEEKRPRGLANQVPKTGNSKKTYRREWDVPENSCPFKWLGDG